MIVYNVIYVFVEDLIMPRMFEKCINKFVPEQ